MVTCVAITIIMSNCGANVLDPEVSEVKRLFKSSKMNVNSCDRGSVLKRGCRRYSLRASCIQVQPEPRLEASAGRCKKSVKSLRKPSDLGATFLYWAGGLGDELQGVNRTWGLRGTEPDNNRGTDLASFFEHRQPSRSDFE